jgi:DNA-binding HxlR family transcriptional regulator
MFGRNQGRSQKDDVRFERFRQCFGNDLASDRGRGGCKVFRVARGCNGSTLRIISGKWKPLVLFFLRDGPKRYGELKRLTRGVSDKVADPAIEGSGGRSRNNPDRLQGGTARVDYSLTPLGRSLADAIVPLCPWGTENAAGMASIFATGKTANSAE